MEKFNLDPQNIEQQNAYELMANTNCSFFLTGRAGTGKTTLLHYALESIGKQFVVLAPTGVAAIQAGGETIHSFFGLPLGVCTPDVVGRMNETRINALLHADAIIIDEVSMVRCDLIDAVDLMMRKILHNPMPFGGKQMIFVGDMFQLPPVVKRGPEKDLLHDMYGTDEFFFYKSRAISRMRLVKIELKKVYRQDDEQFLSILEHVRSNKMQPKDAVMLNQRIGEPSPEDGMVITLASLNSTADEVNQSRLGQLESEEFVYEGTVEGKFEASKFPAEQFLKLKVGAQVMFTRNNHPYWANGTLGTVTKLAADEIFVKTEDGKEHPVECCTWESFSYEYDKVAKKLKKNISGSFTQYPLRLAWAITIHKSQGMTFEKMKLDLSKGLFADGQLYVALSRVRSLVGLFLTRPVSTSYARTNKDVLAYAAGYNDEKLVSGELESGKAVYGALQQHDYDEAARQYLLLVEKNAKEGDVKESMQLVKKMLEVVVCDESLYGSVSPAPQSISNSEHLTPKFLSSVLNLYSGEYESALEDAEWVLRRHQCREALYVKARSLSKLGRFDEADQVHVLLSEDFDMSIPDVKVLYAVSMLNELEIGDDGLDLMKRLVALRPRYDKGILSMRMLMQRRDIKLRGASDNELVVAFNSSISESEFESNLKSVRKENPKLVSALVKSIAKQSMRLVPAEGEEEAEIAE